MVGRIEAGEEGAHGLRPPEHPDHDLRGDAQRPLGADESAEQVGPWVGRAEPDELAVREDDLSLEHMVDGEAVLEAMGSSGVLGDVAADRADLLAGGVGSVEESVRGDGLRDREVGHARLDGDARAFQVDFEDAVHARERDDDPLGDGEGAAGKARSRSAGDEGDAVARAEVDDGLNLRRARRKSDQPGTTRWLVSPSHS